MFSFNYWMFLMTKVTLLAAVYHLDEVASEPQGGLGRRPPTNSHLASWTLHPIAITFRF